MPPKNHFEIFWAILIAFHQVDCVRSITQHCIFDAAFSNFHCLRDHFRMESPNDSRLTQNKVLGGAGEGKFPHAPRL
jgi:hypothetical protein